MPANKKQDKQEKIFPVYLLAGEDQENLKQFIQKVESNVFTDPSEREINSQTYFGDETSPEEIIGDLTTYPVFSKYKIIRVYSPDNLVKNKSFLEYLENPADCSILFLIYNKPAETVGKTIISKVEKHGFYHGVKKLYKNQAAKRIQAELSKSGLFADASVIDYLAEYTENTDSEIFKAVKFLREYFSGKKNLSLDDVKSAISISKVPSKYDFLDYLFNGDLANAIYCSRRILNEMGQVSGIISLMYLIHSNLLTIWNIRGMLQEGATNKSIATAIGRPPFIANKVISQSKQFGFDKLSEIINHLFELELFIKSTSDKTLCVVKFELFLEMIAS